MRDFWVEPVAQAEFAEAAAWYEGEREGLGLEFISEIERTLARIARQPSSPPPRSPCLTVEWSAESS